MFLVSSQILLPFFKLSISEVLKYVNLQGPTEYHFRDVGPLYKDDDNDDDDDYYYYSFSAWACNHEGLDC